MEFNKPMITTIIFDIGDTLVDAPDLFRTIAGKIKESYGLDLEKELIQEFNKLYMYTVFYDIKTILDRIITDALNRRCIASKIKGSEIYKDIFVNQSWLFDGSKEILSDLKDAKIRLIAVSDADSDVLIPELKKLGIHGYFDEVVASSDIKCYKTSKNIAKHIAPKLNGPSDTILFVGNSIVDMNAAKMLGVRSVFINRKNGENIGDVNIKSLTGLRKFLLDNTASPKSADYTTKKATIHINDTSKNSIHFKAITDITK